MNHLPLNNVASGKVMKSIICLTSSYDFPGSGISLASALRNGEDNMALKTGEAADNMVREAGIAWSSTIKL